jgi:hypothetical protein
MAMMPPLKKQQMEQQQTINYAKNVRVSIIENMVMCALIYVDETEESNKKIVHRKQYESLKKLLYDVDFLIQKIEMDINNHL